MLGAVARTAACVAAMLSAAVLPATAFELGSSSPLDWQGFYAGATISGIVGSSTGDYTGVIPPVVVSYPFTINLTGVGLGGVLGYNQDFGAFVLGAEGDLSWVGGASGQYNFAPDRYDAVTLLASGHIRGRAGYDLGAVMPFVSAGLALAAVRQSHLGPVSGGTMLWSQEALLLGLSLGAGVDVQVSDNGTLRLEFIHDSFGSKHYEWVPGGTRYSNANLNIGTLRAAFTVKF
jgi:outer membrane immunogenic protein